jgi:hypothetical protein
MVSVVGLKSSVELRAVDGSENMDLGRVAAVVDTVRGREVFLAPLAGGLARREAI